MKHAVVLKVQPGIPDSHIRFMLQYVERVEGQFSITAELPTGLHDLDDLLYGPVNGDLPIDDVHAYWGYDGQNKSRMTNLHPRKTRFITAIGTTVNGLLVVKKLYAGNAAANSIDDCEVYESDNLKSTEAFWKDHAVSASVQPRLRVSLKNYY